MINESISEIFCILFVQKNFNFSILILIAYLSLPVIRLLNASLDTLQISMKYFLLYDAL